MMDSCKDKLTPEEEATLAHAIAAEQERKAMMPYEVRSEVPAGLLDLIF